MAKKKFYRGIIYYLILGLRSFFMCLPYRTGFMLGGAIGRAGYYLLPKERDKMLKHLKFAFREERSDAQLRQIAKGNFEHYGRMAAELMLLDKIIPRFDEFVTVSGFEHFDKALAGGRGVVIVIAHFGNWELMGGYTSLKGYPCTVIARKIYYEKYDELLVGIREKMKMETIYRDASVKHMLKALKANRLLGFVVDQDVESVDGIFVNFFGRPAYTPTAPVRFAQVSGAPIIPVFIVREGIRHHMIVEPAIVRSQTGDTEKDTLTDTQTWVSIQEKYIRKYPHLWVWNHKRWKTKASGLI